MTRIRQMAPLLYIINFSKLPFRVKDERTLISAKNCTALSSISEVRSYRTEWPRFFCPPCKHRLINFEFKTFADVIVSPVCDDDDDDGSENVKPKTETRRLHPDSVTTDDSRRWKHEYASVTVNEIIYIAPPSERSTAWEGV